MSKIECVEFNSIDELFEWLEGDASENKAEEVYSKRTVISLAEYDKAVEMGGLAVIHHNNGLSHDAIQAMADMGHIMGYILFGEAYLDSKTEKEEN